jgi:hypothetical protein
MYFDLKHPPPQVARELRRVRRILNLPEHFHRTGAGVQPGGVCPRRFDLKNAGCPSNRDPSQDRNSG